MTLVEVSFPKAFRVRFQDLTRFDPASFHGISWHWSNSVMFPIGSALKIRKEKVDRAQYEFSQLQPITIHFDGSIDKRNVEGNRGYSMELFFARPRDIVVAKIDLKNGAVGIVPDWGNIVVTNHFAVYEPDTSKIIPEYFHLIIQVNFFKSYLWRNKVGAEGRKEVKLDFFESIKIPMPSLDEQRKIVKTWQHAQINTANAEKRVKNIEQDMESLMLNFLGISLPSEFSKQKIFPIFWKDLERWDLFFQRPDFVALENQLHDLHALSLGDVLNFESRSWKKSDFPEGKFEYVEISSVNRENGIFSSRTVETNNAPSRATTLIKTGDLIISTTRPYLGAITIVPEKYNNCVCSSGFALATSTKLPDVDIRYVLFFLTSKAGLLQLERRMTGGLYPAIVQEELEKIKIPVPSIEVQKEIMRRVEEGRSKIRQEQEAAAKVAEESESEVERMILGKEAEAVNRSKATRTKLICQRTDRKTDNRS